MFQTTRHSVTMNRTVGFFLFCFPRLVRKACAQRATLSIQSKYLEILVAIFGTPGTQSPVLATIPNELSPMKWSVPNILMNIGEPPTPLRKKKYLIYFFPLLKLLKFSFNVSTPCGHHLKWKLTPENPLGTSCSWPPWPWFSREKR